MQWMGLSGVLRIVQTGKLLGAGLGLHSKHSVWPLMCTLACGQKDSAVVLQAAQSWPVEQEPILLA